VDITIAEAEKLLPQARKIAIGLNLPLDEAPLYLGLISDRAPSKEVIERGKELAKEYGW
jgi:hypothetical protein